MSDILEPIVYLSQEVGPRPAGTEEEQQAALYITEAISKEAGLSTVIEDFRGIASPAPILALLCLVAVVISVVSTAFPVIDLASVIVTAIVAIIYFTEAFDKPILSRLMSRGVSQNVVAKYEPHLPSESGASHPRKVVLVARYDSGKVSRETSKGLVKILPILQWFTLISVIALPILLLLRTIFFPQGGGLSSSIVNILIIITMIGTILPSVKWLLYKTAPYNEAANCNAAGVAVLIEAANRVGQGRVNEALISEQVEQEEPIIHSEEEAWAAGVVPEGTELVYETDKPGELGAGNEVPEAVAVQDTSAQPRSSEQGLAAAKAAIAAMTGQSIPGAASSFEETFDNGGSTQSTASNTSEEDTDEPLPGEGLFETAGSFRGYEGEEGKNTSGTAGETVSGEVPSFVASTAFYAAPEPVSQSNSNVPDWYLKAQEKAKKPKGKERPIQRSKYASALDAAVRESAGHFAEANQIVDHRLEESLNAGLDVIQEVPAPGVVAEVTIHDTPNPWRERREAAAAAEVIQEVPAEPVNLGETTEMAPIDVSSLRDEIAAVAGEISDMDESGVALPSFMDPRKVQEEALAAQAGEVRTTTRVEVSEDEEVEVIQEGGSVEQPRRRQSGEETVTTREAGERPERAENYLEEAQQTFADRVMQRRRARRPVVLPEMDESTPKPAPVSGDTKQRAPLAAGAGNKEAAKSLLTLLPAITADDIVASHGGIENAQADPLLQALPSLSGSIARLSSQPSGSINPVPAVTPAGLTGTFAPVGEELVESMDPEDMFIDDVDDSAYDETFADSGAIASGEYLEMPKSRVSKFLGRFRHKKEAEPEVSAQEWLDVAEDFDPRAEGARRGGWESFQNQSKGGAHSRTAESYEGTTLYEEFDEYDAKTSWEGGAYSAAMNQQARRVESADLDSEDIAEEAALAAAAPVEVDEELRQIYAFRNPEIDAEVWFVALGAELGTHDGMRAFLDNHESELRGAILIDLDALGAGDLTMIETEGVFEQTKISSRLTRYAKKASQASGVPLRTGSIAWETSAATYAMRHGIQAMHLVGMDGKKPAYFGQVDDTVENINVSKLEQNTNFVMEILKSI